MKRLIILTLWLVGCGGHPHKLKIDPAFQPIYDRFLKDAAEHGVNLRVDDLTIQFGDLGGPSESGTLFGRCDQGSDQTPTVTINTNRLIPQWDQQNAQGQESLIYHELGHCVLKRDHDSSRINETNRYGTFLIPKSVMTPSRPSDFFYLIWHEHYLTELFTRRE
jgi:hypothetical protein